MPDSGTHHLSVLILAGGRSTRMGRDKAWLPLGGQPLVERVTRRVLPLADEVIYGIASLPRSGTNSPAGFLELAERLGVPAQVVNDRYAGGGPLAGLHAGLAAATHDLLLMLATDMPFVCLDLIRHMLRLAEGYDVVIPVVPGDREGRLRHEPLHAVYRRTCLTSIEQRLANGDTRLVSFLEDVRVRELSSDEIAPFDPDDLSFFNVNTPDDWRRAERLAGTA